MKLITLVFEKLTPVILSGQIQSMRNLHPYTQGSNIWIIKSVKIKTPFNGCSEGLSNQSPFNGCSEELISATFLVRKQKKYAWFVSLSLPQHISPFTSNCQNPPFSISHSHFSFLPKFLPNFRFRKPLFQVWSFSQIDGKLFINNYDRKKQIAKNLTKVLNVEK